MSAQIEIVNDNDNDPAIMPDQYTQKQNEVLLESIKVVHWVIVSALFAAFSYSSRLTIWYSYAREFDDHSEKGIVCVLVLGYFSLALVGVLYPCIGDVIGYDKAIMIKLVIRCIGIFGECIAMNFIFLSVFFIISQVHLFAVCLSYIAWILPLKSSIKYTSYLFGGYAILYLSGPIIAGILSHYISYRSAFWLNFILNIFMLIISFIFIHGKQHKLEKLQLSLKPEFDEQHMDNMYIFPSILHIDTDRSTLNFKEFWHSISKYEWFQLINTILQNAIALATEALYISYYVVFVRDHFDATVMMATAQIFPLCFGFAIGSGVAPKIMNNEKIPYPFILIVPCIVNIIVFIVVFPLISNIHIFWGLNFVAGLCLGVYTMTSEALILKRQPTEHSGKIGGLKEFIRKVLPAIAVLIAGSLYAQNVVFSIMYVAGVCWLLCLCLSIIYVLVDSFNNDDIKIEYSVVNTMSD